MLELSEIYTTLAPSSLILNQLKAESDNSLAVLKDKTIASSILHETFVKLTPDKLEEIIALQEITFAKLKDEGTEKFLYKKSREEYEALLNHKDSFLIGYFEEGSLVGQLVVKKLEAEEEETGKDYHIPLAKKTLLGINSGIERFSIGGMIVHPEHRGKGLAQKLITEAEKILIASKHPRKVCASAISSTENPGSYLSFMSCGYGVISKFVSNEDGDTDYLLYKPLSLERTIDTNESISQKPSSKKIQDLDNLNEKHCIFRDANKMFHVKDMSLMAMNNKENYLSIGTL